MYIYKTTNLINNKSYIGKRVTNNDWDKTHYYGSGIYLKCAIKSYGKNNFKKEILIDNIFDKHELAKKEIEMINKYDTIYPKGYNLTKGGDGGDCVSNHINRNNLKQCQPKTQEHKNKISKTLMGRKLPQDVINKISKAVSKAKKGKPLSEKSRVASLNGRLTSEKWRQSLINPQRAFKRKQTMWRKHTEQLQIEFIKYYKHKAYFKPNLIAKQYLDNVL